jgi:hypothetical protein
MRKNKHLPSLWQSISFLLDQELPDFCPLLFLSGRETTTTVALRPKAKNLKAQGGVRPAPAMSDRRTFRAPV